MNDTAVVVVNFGTHALIAENIVAVSDQTPDVRVVVVDNFSTAQERAAVKDLCDRRGWLLVALDVNVGFGEGVNRGVEAAVADGAQVLVMLNPDASLDATSLARLRQACVDAPMTMHSPVIRRPDGTIWFAGNVVHRDTGRIQATRKVDPASTGVVTPWLSGACLAVSRALWEKVGGFDPEYFMYWEDIDLSERVQRVGGQVAVLADATAVHDEGGAQRGGPHRLSHLYYYFNTRNRLLFAARHLDGQARRGWMRASAREAYAVLRRGGRRHLLQRGTPVPVVLRATLDGLRLTRTRRRRPGDQLTVMLSFPPPLPTSNPYNVMLAEAVGAVPAVKVLNFSWRGALFGHYDVFHAHWPESTMDAVTARRRAVKQILFLLLLARIGLSKVAWVRTVHNLAIPEGISRLERLALALADRMTVLRIAINDVTPIEPTHPVAVVPHGDYRSWFADLPRAPRSPGRVLFFGTIRRYKGLPRLVSAFRATDDPSLTLRIAGRLSNPDYEPELRALVAGDSRIDLTIGFVTDPDLVREVSGAELVVLPYPEMHNSGSVLAALSLETPVLVPDNEVNRRLATEVGPGWIHLFAGELEPADLTRALDEVHGAPPSGPPDLSARDWAVGGELHAAAYRRAHGLRTGLAEPEQAP